MTPSCTAGEPLHPHPQRLGEMERWYIQQSRAKLGSATHEARQPRTNTHHAHEDNVGWALRFRHCTRLCSVAVRCQAHRRVRLVGQLQADSPAASAFGGGGFFGRTVCSGHYLHIGNDRCPPSAGNPKRGRVRVYHHRSARVAHGHWRHHRLSDDPVGQCCYVLLHGTSTHGGRQGLPSQ